MTRHSFGQEDETYDATKAPDVDMWRRQWHSKHQLRRLQSDRERMKAIVNVLEGRNCDRLSELTESAAAPLSREGVTGAKIDNDCPKPVARGVKRHAIIERPRIHSVWRCATIEAFSVQSLELGHISRIRFALAESYF